MRNRRRDDVAAPPAQTAPKAGFRLRHLLILGLLGALVWQLSPRAKAAWTLRERATQFANYALCMVGPTGPTALRDQPTQFWELVRRRLLASAVDDAPFAECGKLAGEISGSVEVELAHMALAEHFVEYGGDATDAMRSGRGRLGEGSIVTLEHLEVSTRGLSELAEAAWPFERGGYTRLVKPSSHAKEAPHPAEFPSAARGAGLPGWRALYRATWTEQGKWFLAQGHAANLSLFESSDLGRSFRPVGLNQPGLAEHAGRCAAQGSRNAFTFETEEGGLAVHSWIGDTQQSSARLGGDWALLAASCDAETALIAVRNEEATPKVLLCRHAGRCGELPVDESWLRRGFDIARVSGVSIVASNDYGVVRVRSSRDNGAHWTPPTIAFDWQNEGGAGGEVRVPDRLLVLGDRLLLHGQGQDYPILVSDDLGASFQGLAPGAALVNQGDAVSQRGAAGAIAPQPH